jgi:hypothetical protein
VVDDEQQAGRAADGELLAIEGELAYLRVVEGDGGAAPRIRGSLPFPPIAANHE